MLNNLRRGQRMEKISKNISQEEDLGFLLWQLEEIEHFYPCYKSMMEKEE